MVTTSDQELADRGLRCLAEDSSDAEWEYEYHETETEVCGRVSRLSTQALILQELLRHS